MVIRIFLYILFTLVAAPIEIWLDSWPGLMSSNTDLMLRPFAKATVYIYAFILAAETIFRIEQNYEVLAVKPWLRGPQLVSFGVFFLFTIDYAAYLRPIIEEGLLVSESICRQLSVLTVALLSSLLSFIGCEKTKTTG